jgi:hypothetical protein
VARPAPLMETFRPRWATALPLTSGGPIGNSNYGWCVPAVRPAISPAPRNRRPMGRNFVVRVDSREFKVSEHGRQVYRGL